MRRLVVAAGLVALCACIDPTGGITIIQPPPEPDILLPDRLEGDTAPALEPSGVGGVKVARDERATDLYFHEPSEQWYRFTMNRWYMAFTWDGTWFPTKPSEVPKTVRSFEPTREEREETASKKQQTREEELRELEERLKTLEDDQAP